MSKPLELTIYPPVPPEPTDPQQWGDWFVGRVNEEADMARMRFTEAELCAEYESARCDAMIQSATGQCWAPLFDTWPMDPEAIHNRARTLLRFATHPHYFEATEPESDTE
ncbi:hypothetical protein [Arthrobacter sp. Z1-15]